MVKALLLTAAFGDGHRQAAIALRESFQKHGVTVLEEDCFQKTNKWLAKFNTWSYEVITKYFPEVYGASYRFTANFRTSNLLWKLLSMSSRKALNEAINKHDPDIVLQLFPDHASESIRRLMGKPYVGVVITDFSTHSHWFHSNVDAYFIANGALTSSMKRFVGSGVELIDSGIPIRGQFQERKSGNGSGHVNPYVLLSTGGRGVFPHLNRVITNILEGLPNFDIYVLCGRNEKMLKRIQKQSIHEPRLHALSYVEDVATWFRNARFAVIKSGGITVSECLASECPMVFYRPQPGQEADNASFLAQMGAGLVLQNPSELETAIGNDGFLEQFEAMKLACIRLARPNAADVIVNQVLRQTEHVEMFHGHSIPMSH